MLLDPAQDRLVPLDLDAARRARRDPRHVDPPVPRLAERLASEHGPALVDAVALDPRRCDVGSGYRVLQALLDGHEVGGRLLVDLFDARPRQYVVELPEQQRLPRLDRRVVLQQPALERTHPLLERAQRHVAARGMVHEIAVHDREIVVGQRACPRLDRAVAAGARFAQRVGSGEVRAGGAAAVVADAVEAQARGVDLRLALVLLQARDAHARAVGAFPHEQRRQARLHGRRARDHVGREPGLDEHAREPVGVAEGVGGEADRAPPAGELLERLLAELALAPHRIGGGAEQVGLDPPSAHRLPATRLHENPDPIEQRGVVGGQPPVHHRLTHDERRGRVRLEQVDRGARGVERLDTRLARAPDPGEIEVRVPGKRRDAAPRVSGAGWSLMPGAEA